MHQLYLCSPQMTEPGCDALYKTSHQGAVSSSHIVAPCQHFAITPLFHFVHLTWIVSLPPVYTISLCKRQSLHLTLYSHIHCLLCGLLRRIVGDHTAQQACFKPVMLQPSVRLSSERISTQCRGSLVMLHYFIISGALTYSPCIQSARRTILREFLR